MRPSAPSALLRRLWRARLRLKVMAGVVVVTLAALTAFDVGAVTMMRRYLLGQTDDNLATALAVTKIQLRLLDPGYVPVRGGPHFKVTRVKGPPGGPPRSILGEFDIAFLPDKGKQLPLEIGANSIGLRVSLPTNLAKVAAKPGFQTVVSPNGKAQLRADTVTIPGGSLVAATSLDQVDKTTGRFEVVVALGSLAVVLLIGAGVFLVLRRGLRPIETMAAQADKITAGDLTDRVTPHSPRSEVGRLGAALNGMLARIEAGVQEREASQEQMRRFFADASHELRTPIASLRANAELYQQGALTSPDQVDEVMRRITLETRRMGRLVDDMLRLARLGRHPSQGRMPVDLTALVSGCVERTRIAEPDRTWRVTIAEGLTTVGDEELIRRAVDNLLVNVLVHTPRDAVGTVTAGREADQVIIDVRDDGEGVPPEQLPRIFERFYRAGSRPSVPGSGLGLAIATEIAIAHGGTAHAATVAPRGLQVTLTFPAHAEKSQNLNQDERTAVSTRPPVTALPG